MDGQMDNLQEKITPQTHAERCPVCNGFGTLKYGAKTCQACLGKGYVVIPNQIDGENYGKSTD